MRFSIFSVLGVTAYAAVVAAAVVAPESVAGRMVIMLWAAVLIWWVIPVPGHVTKNLFRRVALLTMVIYMAAAVLDVVFTDGPFEGWMPHDWIGRAVYKNNQPGMPRIDEAQVFVVATTNIALVVGALAGGFAVWRRRRL